MTILFSERSTCEAEAILEYILDEFGYRAKQDFQDKLLSYISTIQQQPDAFPLVHSDLRKATFSKQTSIIYKIRQSSIIDIVSIFDTRQHPDTLSKEQ